MKRHNRRNPTDQRVILRARDLVVAGQSCAAVGRVLGCCASNVAFWNRKYGWRTEGRGYATRNPTPELWRCCGQVHPVGPCRVCGTVPNWVKTAE